jgi:hypothetical protein
MKLPVVALLTGFMVSACDPTDHTTVAPESFGLARTGIEADLVNQAIEVANTILAGGDANLFRRDLSPQAGPREVPVSLLSSLNLSGSDVIWVPPNCRCVYIQAPALRRWIDRAKHADGYGDPFDEKYVVAFMLLHEMGHILQGTSGEYLRSEDPASSLNVRSTDAKLAESAADAFAEAELVERLRSGGNQAQTASAIVSNISILSNNIYYAITLGQGLTEIMCLTPTIYWDWGYSHPNLVFRLMETMNRLAPSPQTARIVADFEDCRAKDQKYFDVLR